MTITEQLTTLKDAIAAWMREHRGTVAIAGDAFDLVQKLAESPGTLRAVILFDQEEPRGDMDELGRVDRRIIITCSRGRGFAADPSANLTVGVAGGKPLFQLVEELREVVRPLVVNDNTDEPYPRYVRTSRFEYETRLVDAYQLEITLCAQLPEHHD